VALSSGTGPGASSSVVQRGRETFPLGSTSREQRSSRVYSPHGPVAGSRTAHAATPWRDENSKRGRVKWCGMGPWPAAGRGVAGLGVRCARRGGVGRGRGKSLGGHAHRGCLWLDHPRVHAVHTHACHGPRRTMPCVCPKRPARAQTMQCSERAPRGAAYAAQAS
jgi:hypothetical protein